MTICIDEFRFSLSLSLSLSLVVPRMRKSGSHLMNDLLIFFILKFIKNKIHELEPGLFHTRKVSEEFYKLQFI